MAAINQQWHLVDCSDQLTAVINHHLTPEIDQEQQTAAVN